MQFTSSSLAKLFNLENFWRSFDAIPSAVSASIAKLDNIVSEKDEILAQLNQDMEENGKFGMIELSPIDATKQFLSRLCVSYVENLKRNISSRFPNIPFMATYMSSLPKFLCQFSFRETNE